MHYAGALGIYAVYRDIGADLACVHSARHEAGAGRQALGARDRRCPARVAAAN
ncbi:hypothetical protein [Paenibacillus lemnae]|uniref:Uncharacterized protein n=1 Tax=Paenibacillus lemnae TaxID=1330551 RepID=A0A848M7W8_PAELE|nr:hypothetical protein [Paenibacillus lemnae]NMO97298.1 hypothetical protein [Paenibacillus lemnae]